MTIEFTEGPAVENITHNRASVTGTLTTTSRYAFEHVHEFRESQGDYSFSRLGNAGVVNSAGNMATRGAREACGFYSRSYSNQMSDTETLSGWTASGGAVITNSFSYSTLELPSSSALVQIEIDPLPPVGAVYHFTVQLQSIEGSDQVRLIMSDGTTDIADHTVTITGEARHYVITGTIGNSTTTPLLQIRGVASATVYVSQLQLELAADPIVVNHPSFWHRSGGASQFENANTVDAQTRLITQNTGHLLPRFDGIALEGEVYNNIGDSEDFGTDSVWSRHARLVVTERAAIVKGMIAALLVSDGTGSSANIYTTVMTTSGRHRLSTQMVLQAGNNHSTSTSVTIGILSGETWHTPVSYELEGPGLISMTSDQVHITGLLTSEPTILRMVTYPGASVSGNTNLHIYPGGIDTNTRSILLTGVQCEESPFCSTYLRTTGVPNRRRMSYARTVFDAWGMTALSNNFCGQVVVRLNAPTDVYSGGSATEVPMYVSLNNGSNRGQERSDYLHITQPTPTTVTITAIQDSASVGTATATLPESLPAFSVLDIRYKLAGENGMTIWANGVRGHNSATIPDFAAPLWNITFGSHTRYNEENTAPGLYAFNRINPGFLEDEVIESWPAKNYASNFASEGNITLYNDAEYHTYGEYLSFEVKNSGDFLSTLAWSQREPTAQQNNPYSVTLTWWPTDAQDNQTNLSIVGLPSGAILIPSFTMVSGQERTYNFNIGSDNYWALRASPEISLGTMFVELREGAEEPNPRPGDTEGVRGILQTDGAVALLDAPIQVGTSLQEGETLTVNCGGRAAPDHTLAFLTGSFVPFAGIGYRGGTVAKALRIGPTNFDYPAGFNPAIPHDITIVARREVGSGYARAWINGVESPSGEMPTTLNEAFDLHALVGSLSGATYNGLADIYYWNAHINSDPVQQWMFNIVSNTGTSTTTNRDSSTTHTATFSGTENVDFYWVPDLIGVLLEAPGPAYGTFATPVPVVVAGQVGDWYGDYEFSNTGQPHCLLQGDTSGGVPTGLGIYLSGDLANITITDLFGATSGTIPVTGIVHDQRVAIGIRITGQAGVNSTFSVKIARGAWTTPVENVSHSGGVNTIGSPAQVGGYKLFMLIYSMQSPNAEAAIHAREYLIREGTGNTSTNRASGGNITWTGHGWQVPAASPEGLNNYLKGEGWDSSYDPVTEFWEGSTGARWTWEEAQAGEYEEDLLAALESDIASYFND